MPRLLLEIGCEELPASACVEALGQLRRAGPGTVYVGPRRLAFLTELPEREEDQWVKGPPEHLRGRAAEGFARKQGVAVDELEVRDGFLGVTVHGRSAAETAPELLGGIVRGLAFGKSMAWERGGLRFARPIRWLCARLDDEIVDFEVDGISAGGVSYGHRFTHGEVGIPSPDAYADALRAAGVEPDQDRRREDIAAGLRELGLDEPNPRVLGEVVYLVESPVVLEGRFDERFLRLPERVVWTAMESHQRYFPLGGNRVAFVANGGDPATVVAGNERVLEGRLEDAHFSFERDVARGVEALVEDLGAITFAAGAGSFADKSARLVELVGALGGGEASREAARLAKADQAAELVREFPDLEGHVGAEYARLAGYPEAVCAAIDEQYLPDGADAPLPSTETGRVLSAADKIDTLNVSFGLGHRPTGSRDPYGLRRAAIALDRLATEGKLAIPRSLMADEVGEFVEERYEGLLDVPVEYVRAARKASVRDLGGVARLAQALAALPDERFDPIHTAYTRARRLAEKEKGAAAELDPALLVDQAEIEVAQALERVDPEIAAALDAGDFGPSVEAAAELGPLLDRLFEDVLVMAEDRAVRANRLRLLLNVRDTLGRLGELSQIPR